MNSHKIQILEFIPDKIKDGDSWRKVVRICFGHPTKKNDLGYSSPWTGSHGRSWSSMAVHGELTGEGRGGERKGREAGGRMGCQHGGEEGGAMGGKLGEEGSSASCRLLYC
jgi:hypothetical protein